MCSVAMAFVTVVAVFNVAVVVHGQTPVSPDLGGEDPYAEPKRQDKFVTIDSGNIVSTI